MKVRKVNLIGGPYHGKRSIASHGAVLVGREIYVQDGSENPDAFCHAVTVLRKPDVVKRREEKGRVRSWMKKPTEAKRIEGIPHWRVNAWVQILKLNVPV